MASRPLFLLGLGLLPGLLCGVALLPCYQPSPCSPRYVFLCVSRRQERDLARRLKTTWGEALTRRYRVLQTGDAVSTVTAAHQAVCQLYQYRLQGQAVVLDTEELWAYFLPTGDLYVSAGCVKGLDGQQVQWLVGHLLAHMHLRHAQENMGYSHLAAVIVAWLHRNNHHTTERFGNYLVRYTHWTAGQEDEADQYALSLVPVPAAGKPLCMRGLTEC